MVAVVFVQWAQELVRRGAWPWGSRGLLMGEAELLAVTVGHGQGAYGVMGGRERGSVTGSKPLGAAPMMLNKSPQAERANEPL